MISHNGARTLHLKDYGVKVGNQANCIILDAVDEKEAIRLTSECLYVIRRGEVILETVPARRQLKMRVESFFVDFKR